MPVRAVVRDRADASMKGRPRKGGKWDNDMAHLTSMLLRWRRLSLIVISLSPSEAEDGASPGLTCGLTLRGLAGVLCDDQAVALGSQHHWP